MLQEISESIYDYLQDAGIDTRQIDYKELTDRSIGSLQRPAVNVSINTGNWTKITMTTYKVDLTISLLILVQNIKGEKERRFDIYALMESIAQALFIISMDLELQNLIRPSNFNNVTDNRFNDAGYQLYQMNFAASYNYHTTKEDLGLLRSIVNNYMSDDEIIGETYTSSVGAYYGGHAFEESVIPSLFGGNANTEYRHDTIWAGDARSTFN